MILQIQKEYCDSFLPWIVSPFNSFWGNYPIAIMWKLYENFHILHFQKRIVSAEAICGNTVLKIHKSLSSKSLEKLFQHGRTDNDRIVQLLSTLDLSSLFFQHYLSAFFYNISLRKLHVSAFWFFQKIWTIFFMLNELKLAQIGY